MSPHNISPSKHFEGNRATWGRAKTASLALPCLFRGHLVRLPGWRERDIESIVRLPEGGRGHLVKVVILESVGLGAHESRDERAPRRRICRHSARLEILPYRMTFSHLREQTQVTSDRLRMPGILNLGGVRLAGTYRTPRSLAPHWLLIGQHVWQQDAKALDHPVPSARFRMPGWVCGWCGVGRQRVWGYQVTSLDAWDTCSVERVRGWCGGWGGRRAWERDVEALDHPPPRRLVQLLHPPMPGASAMPSPYT